MNRGLRKLDPSQYHHLRDLYVPHPAGSGIAQIDHVVVSTAGILVV